MHVPHEGVQQSKAGQKYSRPFFFLLPPLSLREQVKHVIIAIRSNQNNQRSLITSSAAHGTTVRFRFTEG